jgi:hypothetical protein
MQKPAGFLQVVAVALLLLGAHPAAADGGDVLFNSGESAAGRTPHEPAAIIEDVDPVGIIIDDGDPVGIRWQPRTFPIFHNILPDDDDQPFLHNHSWFTRLPVVLFGSYMEWRQSERQGAEEHQP